MSQRNKIKRNYSNHPVPLWGMYYGAGWPRSTLPPVPGAPWPHSDPNIIVPVLLHFALPLHLFNWVCLKLTFVLAAAFASCVTSTRTDSASVLRAYPKIDKYLAWKCAVYTYVAYKTIKHLQTIRKISDELWDEIRLILTTEKPNKTIGCPVVPFRKVLDGILYVF